MGDGYETDLAALRDDARIWSTAATDLTAPKTTVASLTLGAADIGLIAVGLGLAEVYENLRQRVDGLLGGAQQSFGGIATTLTDVATAYETEEEDAADRMSGAGESMGES